MSDLRGDLGVLMPPSRHARPRITTQALLAALWRGKWVLVGVTALGLALAVLYLHVATPTYSATVIIAPREPQTRMNSLFGAALPGLVAQSNNGPIERWVALLGSVRLAQELEKKYGLMKEVFAQEWDPATQTFQPPSSLRFRLKEWVKSILGLRPWAPPTVEDLAEYIGSSVRIAKTDRDLLGQSEVLRISLSGTDPKFIARVLREIFTTADGIIREDKAAEYRRNIDYLKHESQLTPQNDLRLSLTQLLAEEIKNEMLVGEGEAYIASIIEWPYASERPTSPNGKLVLLFGLVLGLMLGFGAALLYGTSSRTREMQGYRALDGRIAEHGQPGSY